MPENIASQQQGAKHLAARAVMAYRAGFPVTLLSVTSGSERPSGIRCRKSGCGVYVFDYVVIHHHNSRLGTKPWRFSSAFR
jgi:hypothetical protein